MGLAKRFFLVAAVFEKDNGNGGLVLRSVLAPCEDAAAGAAVRDYLDKHSGSRLMSVITSELLADDLRMTLEKMGEQP